jgi:hypothetical protein
VPTMRWCLPIFGCNIVRALFQSFGNIGFAKH